MNKHFLVTISNDVNNLYGVRFLCSFFNTVEEHQITLLHICQQDKNNMHQTLNQMWKGPADGGQTQLPPQVRKAINKARELLGEQHQAIHQVMTKTCAERYGKVRDILREGSSGLYDAIVLGKRASYALQWMFERPADETARAIISEGGGSTPLWICPEIQANRKDVLVCLDGSENAYRAVDHVGYMLEGQEQHKIVLFHVATGVTGEDEALFHRAETILQSHAVAGDRISRRMNRGLSVAGTIQGEIDKGGYAAAAIGLHGATQGSAKRSLSLAGSITTKLIAKAEKASLWCCP